MPRYDADQTALLLVDPYRDFLDPAGALWPSVRDVAESVGLRTNLAALVRAARAAGVRVFVAPHRRWRPGDVDGWQRATRPHRVLRDRHPFPESAAGGHWVPDLAPRDGDVVATEHWGMSGFVHTDLDQQLRQHGIETVILAGMTAPGCVEGTGRQAIELGYRVTLVQDATAAFTHEHHHAAVALNGPLYAEAVLPTAEVTAALQDARP